MFKDFKTNVKFVLLDNLGRLIFLGHNKPRGKGQITAIIRLIKIGPDRNSPDYLHQIRYYQVSA